MDRDWTELAIRIGTGVLGGLLTLGAVRYFMHDDTSELTFRELKYGRKLRAFATVFMIFSFALAAAGLIVEEKDGWMVSLVGAGLMLIAGGLMLEVFRVRIQYDDSAVVTVSPWRPDRRIPWSAITGYAFSEANQWHVFRTSEFGEIRLPVYLVGLQEFFDFAEARLPAQLRSDHN